MIIDIIKKCFPSSWGSWEKTVNGEVNVELSYIRTNLYMNYIFSPVHPKEKMLKDCDILDRIPEELRQIYTECNGFRLFLSSFSIYGQQERKNEMEPFDIRTENYNIHSRMKKNKVDDERFLFFGSVCKDVAIAYCSNLKKPYVCMKKGYADIIIDFASIEEFIRFYIPRMVELYDENFKKKRPNKDFESTPVLANALMSIGEIS